MQKETFSLLLFHGSAKEDTKNSAITFCETISEKTVGKKLSYCFLKGHKPTLIEALTNVFNDGNTNITIYPLFVLPGFHVDYDIPQIVKNFMKTNKDTIVTINPCLTKEPQFANAIINLINQNHEN